MDIAQRNNVHTLGKGATTIIFSHGFGCDQSMWRYLAPLFEKRFRIILFDLTGSGNSDLSAYDYIKYNTLDGYASDLLEIIDEFADSPVIYVGHSVSAMIGLLASIKAPEKFITHILIGSSPCYINNGEYQGGFSRADIEELCKKMESNYFAWSSTMAPAFMGAPEQPELARELTDSFLHTDPNIAIHFARVIFFSDHRSILSKCTTPTLILQCSDDFIAPRSVGEYMKKNMRNASLKIIDNIGHCPHMSAPDQSTKAIENFLLHMR